MEIVYLAIGLLLGFVVAFALGKIKNTSASTLYDVEKKAREEDKQSFGKQIEDLNNQHSRQIEDLKQQCSKQVDDLNNQHSRQIDELKKQWSKQVEDLRNQHSNECNNLRTIYEKQISTIKEEKERQEIEAKQETEKRIEEIKNEHSLKTTELVSSYENQLNTLRNEAALRLNETRKEAKQQLDEEKALQQSERETHENRMKALKQENAEQRNKELEALRRSYEEQLALFKEQVVTATEKLLKDRSGELQEANTQKMDELFKPIKDNISRMEKSMNENREANARNNASFEKTIQQMMESNTRLSDQADRLSTALQRKNKTVGNWGELILSELLESQGLEEGVHFDVQQSIKDEDGRSVYHEENGNRMIPDVILHLADNRDVVVDSKMSLTAFIDYQNAENEEERKDALERHLTSIHNHIKELSQKKYNEYITKSNVNIDFVIMFVPIEGALSLAMSERPELWREAFDKKVFIAGGQTLIAALRIIDLTWVNVKQERNTAKVMDEARKLIDRVGAFYKEFKIVGRKLEEAAKSYSDVAKRVDEGSQSILSTGRRMQELGARGKNALPEASAE